MLRHHSVVELVDRAVAAGLVERIDDVDDQRVVRIRLSDSGVREVDALAGAHLEELSRLRSQFAGLWDDCRHRRSEIELHARGRQRMVGFGRDRPVGSNHGCEVRRQVTGAVGACVLRRVGEDDGRRRQL